ncbi:MAG: DNA polymerase III subunit gamma/tau [Deltaproteobacteria bacterium]|nr:DNA polymerase III subunit gamma/tau [Deltaproteobacteria bacterium]
MEYLVLARKWRPQRFEDVVGQDHVVKTLTNAIRLGRIAHAYIFSGPRGTGKTSVARILSKALNCETGPAATPCNICSQCRDITEGVSLDVREIDGASNRGIDEIRELRESIKFAPASSRYKIFIIDEVHMLTKEAFNALLKTLEEPPAHALFIFATTEMHRVPPTILSRCQHFDFRRIPLRRLAESLRDIADKEQIQISDSGLAWIARAGDGSFRDALSIFDQAIAYGGASLSDGDLEELLGRNDRRFLSDLSQAIIQGDAAACLRIIDDAYFAGIDPRRFYQSLIQYFLDIMSHMITGGKETGDALSDEDRADLARRAEGRSRDHIQQLLDGLMDESEEVRRSDDPRINLEYVAVKLASLDPLVPLIELAARLEGLEQRLRSAGPAVAEKSHVPPQEPFSEEPIFETEARSAETRDGARGQWEDLKMFITKKSSLLGSKIAQGTLLFFDGQKLRIGFPADYVFLDNLREKAQFDQLSQFVSEFFGAGVLLEIEAMNGGETNKRAPSAAEEQRIKSEALRHPLVQKVIDVFEGAEVGGVTVKNLDEHARR